MRTITKMTLTFRNFKPKPDCSICHGSGMFYSSAADAYYPCSCMEETLTIEEGVNTARFWHEVLFRAFGFCLNEDYLGNIIGAIVNTCRGWKK